MVDFFKESDRKSVIGLWRQAFYDEESYVNKFIDSSGADILVYRIDNIAVGMVSLLDVCLGELKGGYIFALAVDEKYQKRGIATRLLSFAQDVMINKDCKFSIVVPEPYDSLEGFYKNLGFNFEIPLCKSVIKSKKSGLRVSVSSVEKEEYYQVRTAQQNVISHSPKFFEYVYEDLISDGFHLLKIRKDNIEAYCVCLIKGDCITIKEMLPIDQYDDFSYCVCEAFNVEKAILISHNGEQKQPFALMKVFDCDFNANLYANLLLDSFGG